MARATYPVDFETGRSFREPQSGHPVQFTFGIQTLAREITKINLFFKRMRILAKNSTVDQAQNRAGRSPNRFTITVATAFRLWKRRLYLVEISAG